MLKTKYLIISLFIFLAACATKQEESLGRVALASFGAGPTVYYGDINRKYRVIKKVYEKRRQIPGPNYYDRVSGAAWMRHQGKQANADAIIHFKTKRLPGKIPILDPGWYEAEGVAVRFVN